MTGMWNFLAWVGAAVRAAHNSPRCVRPLNDEPYTAYTAWDMGVAWSKATSAVQFGVRNCDYDLDRILGLGHDLHKQCRCMEEK